MAWLSRARMKAFDKRDPDMLGILRRLERHRREIHEAARLGCEHTEFFMANTRPDVLDAIQ